MSVPVKAATRRERSRVGVLDRSVGVLAALEAGVASLSQVSNSTGLPRPTVHRLLRALAAHGLVRRAGRGYALGPALIRLGASAARDLPLADAARPALERLTRATGESSQLYVRVRDERLCVAAVESPNELRTIVDPGASLPLTAGSAAKVFLADAEQADRERLLRLSNAPATFRADVAAVGRRGWAHSAGERQSGVGSVSAPVRGGAGRVLAVVSVSGPMSRMRSGDAARHARHVVAAATEIETAIGSATSELAAPRVVSGS